MATDNSAALPGEFYLNESILLDTTGAWSWLAVVVAARGSQAEALRQELAGAGLAGFSEKRLALCAARFSNARRIGPLEYRDDAAASEFFLAEVFEIKDFLTVDPQSQWYKLDLASEVIGNFLAAPESAPCHLTHVIELHSLALPPAVVQQRSIETEFLRFHRLRKTLAGYWTMKFTLSAPMGAAPAGSLDEHRRAIQKIRTQCGWSLLAPVGDRRPHERGDFGRLPAAWDPAFSVTAAPLARPVAGSSATVLTQKFRRRRRTGKISRKERQARWSILAGCGLALLLILIVVLVAKNADHWNLFKVRPQISVPSVTS